MFQVQKILACPNPCLGPVCRSYQH